MGLKKTAREIRSFRLGEEWEDDVQDVIFPSYRYDILHKSPSFEENNIRYIESSLQPDFKFRDKRTKKEFWVECKFRRNLVNDKVEWAKPAQFERLKVIQEPVFICLALDIERYSDERYFLIPMQKIKYTGLYTSVLWDYEIGFSPMVSNILWKL